MPFEQHASYKRPTLNHDIAAVLGFEKSPAQKCDDFYRYMHRDTN